MENINVYINIIYENCLQVITTISDGLMASLLITLIAMGKFINMLQTR